MTVPFYCLLVLVLLVVVTKVPVAVAQIQGSKKKSYNNSDPRGQQALLTGWGKRALNAHQNNFEALMIFTPAVLISHFAPIEAAGTAATLALVHTAARLIYPVLYIADKHLLRSLVWITGFIVAVWMCLLPALT